MSQDDDVGFLYKTMSKLRNFIKYILRYFAVG